MKIGRPLALGCLAIPLGLAALVGCGDDESTPGDPVAPRNGLLSEYLFNGNANDTEGTNHGTPAGGPTLNVDRFGVPNRAYSFDGINDVITTAQDDFADGNNVSVSLWFKVPSTAVALRYFVVCSDFGVWTQAADAGLAISTPATNSAGGSFGTANEWHHFLGTYDGTDISTYIDGVLVEEQNHPGDISDQSRPLTFGLFGNSYWPGILDDIRIYNRTIQSAQDIANLYHEGGYAQ